MRFKVRKLPVPYRAMLRTWCGVERRWYQHCWYVTAGSLEEGRYVAHLLDVWGVKFTIVEEGEQK